MKIIFEKSFDKQFKKLSKSVQEKFYKRLHIFQESPYDELLKNHKLKGSLNGYRSINITGDYRAIYIVYTKIDDTYKFIAIGTHSQLYT